MIKLAKAKEFAKSNYGEDAVVVGSDLNGDVLYRLIPLGGLEGKKLGPPILFTRNGEGFAFLSRDEVDDYLDQKVANVRYEDD